MLNLLLIRLAVWLLTVAARAGFSRTDQTASVRGADARRRAFLSEKSATVITLLSLLPALPWLDPPWLTVNVVHMGDMLSVHLTDLRDDPFPERLIAVGILAGALAIVGLALNHARRVAKQHEAALRASEERSRLITERSTDLIAVVDHLGCVRYASPTFRPALGYDPARLIGRPAFSQIHPDDVADTTARLASAHRHGTSQAIFRLRHADGVWRWIEAQSAPLIDNGQPATMIIGRDITERKLLEAELHQLQKLHSLGHLTSGVVHDFNNLLTGIAGFAELGLRGLPAGHAIREDLEEIRGTAARAATLANQLLAFVRNQPTEPRLIDPSDLVRNLDKLLRRLLGTNIELVSLTPPELGWIIKADPGQIEQVLVNLAINARDAMPHGGTLTIAAANITLNEGHGHPNVDCAAGEYLVLEVSDTGVGMDAATQARLFEPFFTTKAHGHGTGLGLSTCYRIIRQHGGDIRIASAPGHGTTISIYLPRVVEINTDAAAVSIPSTTDLPRGTGTVLVVEDEGTVRTLAARVLRNLGYTVLEARNGAEALEIVAQRCRLPIHVLLTDVALPQIDGTTLAARLMAQYPDMPIIFMSGTTEGNHIREDRLDPNVLFLQKPFSCTELAYAVREAVDTHAVPRSVQR